MWKIILFLCFLVRISKGLIESNTAVVPEVPQDVAISNITSSTVVAVITPPNNTLIAVTQYIITVRQDIDDCNSFNDASCHENDQQTFAATADNRYTITGLQAYRKYVVSVVAVSLGGRGESSSNFTFTTAAGRPNPIFNVVTVSLPEVIIVTFNAGTPITGPTSHGVILIAPDGSIRQAAVTASLSSSISITVPNVSYNTVYKLHITSTVNDVGSSQLPPGTTVTSVPSSPSFTVARDSDVQLTLTIQADGATSYLVSYIQANCPNCTAQTLTSTDTTVVLSELIAYTTYKISAFAVSAAGTSSRTTLSQRTRAGTPTLRDPNYTTSFTNTSDEETYPPYYTVTVNNVCEEKSVVFNEDTGVITKMIYIVTQNGSTVSIDLSRFWATFGQEDVSSPYVSFTVRCENTSNRKKRAVVNNGVVIGADNTCQTGTNTECNGRLKPDTAYTIRVCGANEDNNSVCTKPSVVVKTSLRELTAGEVAAIMLCYILVLIIIIRITVYCVERRRSHIRKHRVSRSGKQNPAVDFTMSQQKDQSDSAAEPQTQHTEPAVA
ncbi:phosphatidylinositol phosphatase PTPRQ-like [Styela clava]